MAGRGLQYTLLASPFRKEPAEMNLNVPRKPKRWELITDAVTLLGVDSLESVKSLAEKYNAIKVDDGLIWINVGKIKRESAKQQSRRRKAPNAQNNVHKFEMHIGRLRHCAEVQLANMISDCKAVFKEATSVLGSATATSMEMRRAERIKSRCERQVASLQQRIADTQIEIDRLERLDDDDVARWYQARGWTMPGQEPGDQA